MKNTILDYIELRGDLSPLTHPYNEIDYLIFSELTYIDFHEFLDFSESMTYTIEDAYHIFLSKHLNIADKTFLRMYTLFSSISRSPRYRNIKIVYYVNEVDQDLIKQFSILALLLENQTLSIHFKGTDDTFIGWHEDFLMLCDESIPSQRCAVEHLEKLSAYPYELSLLQTLKNPYLGQSLYQRFKNYFKYKRQRPILLAGHSKGGNLAMYAGLFAKQDIQDRIIHVYNYDGPGFLDEVYESDEYSRFVDRMTSFVPHYSLFGILLRHGERRKVVRSIYSHLKQHDGMSWEISRDGFKEDVLSIDSQIVAKKIEDMLASLSKDEKRLFIKDLFHTLDKLGFKTINDLSNVSYKHIVSAVIEFSAIEAKSRKIIMDLIYILFEESQKMKKSN